MAEADDLPVTVPEAGTLGVSLRGSYQRADDRFDGDGERRSLDSAYDELVDVPHENWQAESLVGELTLDWSPGAGIQLSASAPLVRNSAEGDTVGSGGPAGEEFTGTGLGDLTLAVSVTRESQTLYRDAASNFEPMVVRSQLFAYLPTGSDPSFEDTELGTGDGGFALGLLFDGYQRVACGDLAAALGYTWRDDQNWGGGVFQGELGAGWWPIEPLRLSVSVLAHTYEGEGVDQGYGSFPIAPVEDQRQILLSVAPAISYVHGPYVASLALRAPRTGDGLSLLDTGIPLLGERSPAPAFPPLSLTLSARFF